MSSGRTRSPYTGAMDQMFGYHRTAVQNYLGGWRWRADTSTGGWCRCSFGMDARALADAFARDTNRFPRSSVCALLANPEVNFVADVLDVLLPEVFAGELAVVGNALQLACDVKEDNPWGAVLAGVSGVVAIGLLAYATRDNRRGSPVGTTLVRQSRRPRPQVAPAGSRAPARRR